MSKPLLHVIFSPSGAGTLRLVLGRLGRSDRVVCPFDDFSFGPIGADDGARVAWVDAELGVADWQDVVAVTAPFLEASCSDHILPVVWISRRDAGSYAGFLWWLAHLGNAPCMIVDVTETTVPGDLAIASSNKRVIGPSDLTPDEMTPLLGSETHLDPALREKYQAQWKRLVSDNASLRIVGRHGALISVPISYFDPLLLSLATTTWQGMARIVGEALASFWNDDVRQTSNLILGGRVRRLVETGALESRGDPFLMRACELRLPVAMHC